MEIGKQIRHRRTELNLSRSELANKIQINGVPALVVNGKMVQTLDGSVIQDALNK